MASQVVTGTVTFTSSFQVFQTAGLLPPQAILGVLVPLGSNAASLSYPNGTASGQVDQLHCKPYTLSAAATTIDLTSLLDPAGNSVNFARVREFAVYNPEVTAGHDLKISGGASNPWIQVPPTTQVGWCYAVGGVYRLSDYTSTGSGNGMVVSGTSKTIKLDPGSNTITVWLLIAGGSVV